MLSNQTQSQAPPNFQDFGGSIPFYLEKFFKDIEPFPTESFKNLGKIGDTRVGRTDVRTPLMYLLEAMMGQTASNLFQNPFAFSQHAQALPGVGGVPQQTAPNFEGIPGALGTDPLQQAFAQAFSGLFGGGSAPLTGQPGRQGGQPQPRSQPTLSPEMWMAQYLGSGPPGDRTATPGGPIIQSGPATGAPMGDPITPQNYPDLPPAPDNTQLGGGVDLSKLLSQGALAFTSGFPTQQELIAALNPSQGYRLPQGLQGLGIPDTVQGAFDTISRLFSAPHLVSPNINEEQRASLLGETFRGLPTPITKGWALRGFGSGAEQQAPLVERALGISGSMPLGNIMDVLFGPGWQQLPDVLRSGYYTNYAAQGGQLDPNAINIVGEFGPEMVVGNQVIPFGNRPVGLFQLDPTRPGGLQLEQYLGSPDGARYVGSPSAIGSLFPDKPQVEQYLGSPEGSRYVGSASALGGLFGQEGLFRDMFPSGSQQPQPPGAPTANTTFGFQPGGGGLPGGPGIRDDRYEPQIPPSIPQFNFGQLPQFPQLPQVGGFQGNQRQIPNLPQFPSLPQVGGFQPGTLQGAGTGAAQRFLEANPEQQTFNLAQNQLQPLISGGGAAQGIMGALQPLFQRNLQFGLGELRNLAPSTANQALQRQGTDLTAQALQDYNLLSSQALQQGQQTQLQSLGLLGQLAGQAGQAPFGRALQAGQLGLQESQAQTAASQQAAAQNAANLLSGFQALSGQGLGAGQLGLQEAQAQTAANQQAAAQNAQNLLGGFQAQSGQALGAGQLGLQGLTGLRGQDIQREYGLRQLAQQQSQFANTFGLQAQQQAFEQQTNPSLQLLLALLGLSQPTGYQTIASQG